MGIKCSHCEREANNNGSDDPNLRFLCKDCILKYNKCKKCCSLYDIKLKKCNLCCKNCCEADTDNVYQTVYRCDKCMKKWKKEYGKQLDDAYKIKMSTKKPE